MVLKGFFVLMLVAVVTAGGAFMISLDTMAASRSDDTAPAAVEEKAVQQAQAHGDHNTALPLESFAGQVPANSAELAKAQKPYDATLPPLQSGDVVKVHMVMKHKVVEIAPGVKYNVWAFDEGAPGPIVHVRQGQTVEFTLTNGGTIPHSMDFHAARIAPNVAF